ncbi:malonate decarboxylase holo-ACP synthase [Paraburkholderia sp. BCC1884]|uniref:malonate decarboxylase holo-ACP synthase n=1 Tax=Paraburkholderia sp. BCC1884 TaxID=2562668 RepID=UPI001182198E|nr:malonate decarboxylase holo-ACP synthase [Paraburkholderia sp. BCC1884]
MQVCATSPFAQEQALASDARWRPHDLLQLRSLSVFDDEPPWVREAFARAPYAVVRRALAADGFVAIGVRGVGRSQRYGTWAQLAEIVHAVSPDMLAKAAPLDGRATLPAFVAFHAMQSDPSGLLAGCFDWGPTGSVGFELTTQIPVVSVSSDLDLLIRTPEPLSLELAAALLNHLQTCGHRAGIRVDAQLETPAGGVALSEWAAGKARVMARHARGPQLIADPWADNRSENA